MKILINYADALFKKQQRANSLTAKWFGNFDKIISYNEDSLGSEFREKFKERLSMSRGGGYWLWKSYLILKTLESLNDGDYLFYCDSGAIFINKIDPLIEVLERDQQTIMTFELPLIEIQWTNTRCLEEFGTVTDEDLWDNQRLGGYILIKKRPESISFFKEYYELCQKDEINTDQMNDYNRSIYFIDHRHDQSVLSLLAKKYNLPGYREPSDYGDIPTRYIENNRFLRFKDYANSTYPRILLANRKAAPIIYWLKSVIRDLLNAIGSIGSICGFVEKRSR